jgi:hypothetical protein
LFIKIFFLFICLKFIKAQQILFDEDLLLFNELPNVKKKNKIPAIELEGLELGSGSTDFTTLQTSSVTTTAATNLPIKQSWTINNVVVLLSKSSSNKKKRDTFDPNIEFNTVTKMVIMNLDENLIFRY